MVTAYYFDTMGETLEFVKFSFFTIFHFHYFNFKYIFSFET